MNSFIINQIRKFHGYYREHGFFWVCRHLVTNLMHYYKLVILETEVNHSYPEAKASIPVAIRFLTDSDGDIDRLTEFWPPHDYAPPFATRRDIREIIVARLKAGERCLVAEHEGKIIYMNWVGFYGAHVFESYEKKRGLFPGEAIGHSTFCAEAFRNQHVTSAARSELFRFLTETGTRKVVSYVDPDNVSSSRVVSRFGARPVKMLHVLKILGLTTYYFTKTQ